MSDISSLYDVFVAANEAKCQGLKHSTYWPPVDIDFEDIIYTVENGIESK